MQEVAKYGKFAHENMEVTVEALLLPLLLLLLLLYVFHVFLLLSMYTHRCLCILIVVYAFLDAATLTEVFPCFFLGCKANARVILAKTGHGPHSSKMLCCSMYCLFCIVLYIVFV